MVYMYQFYLIRKKQQVKATYFNWEDPEGLGGQGGGRGDWDGEYMYIHGWFISMYDKNHYNIVK